MKYFWRKPPLTEDEIYRKLNPHIWTCPMDGYYYMSAKMYHSKPTGKFEMQDNPHYRWWRWWEPKQTLQEIYEIIVTNEAEQIRLCKAGEELDTEFALRIK